MLAARYTPGQRLLGVFVLAILVPGLVLAAFGARALWQERGLAQRRLQDRLIYAADSAARALAGELDRLRSAASQPPPDWPKDGSWAQIMGHDVFPQGVLPYELAPARRTIRLDSDLERAKAAELEGLAPARAVDRYNDMLKTAPASSLPEVRHRLALAVLHSGRTQDAVKIWKQVAISGGWIGSLPADLVAGFETAALDDMAARDFYAQLTSGRWRLEKARYLYYSASIRQRVTPDPAEDRALQLAEAVESAMSGTAPPQDYFVFQGETPGSAVVLSLQFLEARLSSLLDATGDGELRVAHITAGEQTIVGGSAAEPRLSRRVDRADLEWTLDVAPKDAAAFVAGNRQRTTLYLGILVLVLMALGAGGYMAIRTVRRELEVARLKSEFVSTVSHEFRSPLTSIRQLGEMLARGRVSNDAKRQQYYDLILRESERLGRLVENVLDFSRMEGGRKEYRFEALDTSAWLRSVVEEFCGEATRAGCHLEAAIPDRLPSIEGDAVALSTAVRNLLDNAVKYSPGASAVWLEAEDVGDGVRIRVRDRGVGIPRAEQRQIFEKFYRGEGEMSKNVKGAGLGLSLVRHIVESHGGTISVESREGEGATFSIRLARAI